MAPADRADPGNKADPVGREDEDEDRGEEPERPLDEVRADDAFEQAVADPRQPLEKFCAPPGTCVIRRVATWAKTIRPIATIHVTTIEFVIGKPKGRAISTAFCGRPCSHGLRQRENSHDSRRHSCREPGSSTAHAIAPRAPPGSGGANGADHVETRAAWHVTGVGDPPASRMLSAMPEDHRVVVAKSSPFSPSRQRVFCAGRRWSRAADVCCSHWSGRPRPGRESMMLRQTVRTCGLALRGRGSGRAAGPRATGNLYGDSVRQDRWGAAATAPVTIVVDRKMPQAEADKLLAAFKSGGAAALRKAMVGVAPTGSVSVGGGCRRRRG